MQGRALVDSAENCQSAKLNGQTRIIDFQPSPGLQGWFPATDVARCPYCLAWLNRIPSETSLEQKRQERNRIAHSSAFCSFFFCIDPGCTTQALIAWKTQSLRGWMWIDAAPGCGTANHATGACTWGLSKLWNDQGSLPRSHGQWISRWGLFERPLKARACWRRGGASIQLKNNWTS